jgi:4-hydroxy-tetrahydrodipicolinate synthase
MPEINLSGTGVALVTPFNDDLNIDFNAFEKILKHTIDGKVDYFVVQGTTGESVTVTEDEKKEILHFVKSFEPGKPVVFGIGGNDTRKVLHAIDNYSAEKIDAILSVCPYYNKPSQAGLINHFTMIADHSPFPVILYNVPGRTSVNLTAESTAILSRHSNIIGVKEASGSFTQCAEIAGSADKDFLLISGDDLFTLPMMTVGCKGVISVLANAIPDLMSSMVNYALKGNFSEAGRVLLKMTGINPHMYSEGNPTGVKYLMELQGLCKRIVRPPLAAPSESLQKKIRDEFEKIKRG